MKTVTITVTDDEYSLAARLAESISARGNIVCTPEDQLSVCLGFGARYMARALGLIPEDGPAATSTAADPLPAPLVRGGSREALDRAHA